MHDMDGLWTPDFTPEQQPVTHVAQMVFWNTTHSTVMWAMHALAWARGACGLAGDLVRRLRALHVHVLETSQ